mmetsp:Transcript_16426/g.40600  ORF Transcript_16426/g.40600 Transcript_16426/m.40600 type:complete len:206 (-) Transcript_16426:1252-1869(-)
MWRHPRPVLRPPRTLPGRRQLPGDKLPLHGRLRRQRVLLRGDLSAVARAEGPVSRAHVSDPRKPRIAADHPSVRFLRRVFAQVRFRECLAVLHRNFRLPRALRADRGQDFLRARGALAGGVESGRDPRDRPEVRGAPRRSHVRFALERSRGVQRLGPQPAGRGISLRRRRGENLQPGERHSADRAGAPAGDGGLQMDVYGRRGRY